MPSQLGLLTNLEHIQLYGNSIKCTLVSELGYLDKLPYLDVHGTDVTGLITDSFIYVGLVGFIKRERACLSFLYLLVE